MSTSGASFLDVICVKAVLISHIHHFEVGYRYFICWWYISCPSGRSILPGRERLPHSYGVAYAV
eukprot:8562669-Pyramimonas_sp.AAC.1